MPAPRNADYDRLNQLRNVGLARRIAAHLQREGAPSGPILDVGVASGRVTEEIQRVLSESSWGARWILATDHRNYLDEGVSSELDFALADASDLPFKDGSFAVVLLLSVYEHIEPARRSAAIAELHRVLAPGGLFLGQIPNMNFPIEPHSRLPLVQFLPRSWEAWAYARFSRVATPEFRAGGVHWYRFNRSEFVEDVRAAGFRGGSMVHSEYDPALFPRALRFAAPLLDVVPLGWDFWFRKS
jgi:SAM-dependent methyltransferase